MIETDPRVGSTDLVKGALQEVPMEKIIMREPVMTDKIAQQVRAMVLRIETGGDIWPIVVCQRQQNQSAKSQVFDLVVGETLYLAYRDLGRHVAPALFIDRESREARLIDRLVGTSTDPFQAARDLEELKSLVNFTDAPIGEMLGMKRGQVVQLRSLLNLPNEIEQDIRSRELKISPSALVDIAQRATTEEMWTVWCQAAPAYQGHTITRARVRAIIAQRDGVPEAMCRPVIIAFAKFSDGLVTSKTAINAVEEAELRRVVSDLSTKLTPALAYTPTKCPPADT